MCYLVFLLIQERKHHIPAPCQPYKHKRVTKSLHILLNYDVE